MLVLLLERTAEGFISLGYMFFYFNDFSAGEEGAGVDGEVGRANRQGVLDEKER